MVLRRIPMNEVRFGGTLRKHLGFLVNRHIRFVTGENGIVPSLILIVADMQRVVELERRVLRDGQLINGVTFRQRHGLETIEDDERCVSRQTNIFRLLRTVPFGTQDNAVAPMNGIYIADRALILKEVRV